MNNPHTANTADDRQDDDNENHHSRFRLWRIPGPAYEVWKDGTLSDPDKGNEIRRLALVALANRDENSDDETSTHTDGPAEPHTQAGTLESDAAGLMGGEDEFNAFLDRIAPARPMSKAELRRAKERLTGRTDEDDVWKPPLPDVPLALTPMASYATDTETTSNTKGTEQCHVIENGPTARLNV